MGLTSHRFVSTELNDKWEAFTTVPGHIVTETQMVFIIDKWLLFLYLLMTDGLNVGHEGKIFEAFSLINWKKTEMGKMEGSFAFRFS